MTLYKKDFTVLLLSAPIGSGHRLAAEALEQEFNARGVRVVQGNIFDFFPHFLGDAFLRCYLWVLTRCPSLYETAYRWGNRKNGSMWLRSLLNGTLAYLGRGFIEKTAPDAVIATHATPAGIMGIYKKRRPGLWLGAVVTDFTCHRWWICKGVDTYFIADAKLREQMPADADVQAFGIPLRRSFLSLDRESCRASFGWGGGEKICLLMGGGEGLLPMDEIAAALLRENISGLRLIAVTGRNAAMAAGLRRLGDSRLEVCGFRSDVPQLMAAADMIVTKAGALTCAEVLAAGLELIIYKPLPGQEEGNAAFLGKHCGAHLAADTGQLAACVRRICAGGGKRRVCGHPEAAGRICGYALEKAKNNLFT